MKTISVSTELYAAIWSRLERGEETEEEILRRLLRLPKAPQETPSAVGGFYDDRNDIRFPEGFEIFRTYKGTQYRARATNNQWLLLNNKKTYSSLHKLGAAIVAGPENAWYSWKYRAENGKDLIIHELRR